MKKLFLIIIVELPFILPIIVLGQTTPPAPQDMPNCIISGLDINSGYSLYQSGTLVASGNNNISGTAKVDFKASKEIHLLPGFSASDFTVDGEFHAFIEELPFDVAWFEPTTNVGSVPKYKKFELGIKLPDWVNAKIDNFLDCDAVTIDCETLSGSINPFDSSEISIDVDFFSPDGRTIRKYGFYYEEFSRDVRENLSVSDFLGGYPATQSKWDPVPTEYRFRIRFAPDYLGYWSYKIKIFVEGNYIGEYDNEIDVVPSNDKGFVLVDNNRKYLKYSEPDNGSLFLIGDNSDMMSEWLYPNHDDIHKNIINSIVDNGGNFVELMMIPNAFGIEREAIGNYASKYPQVIVNPWLYPGYTISRQMNAWELDSKVKFIEEKGIYCQIALDMPGTYPIGDIYCTPNVEHGNDAWWALNWNPAVAGDVCNPYNIESPTNHGHTSTTSVIGFFNDENCMKFYKRKLRYINARWGYSPHIVSYEIHGELNNSTYGYCYGSDVVYRDIIRTWTDRVSSYLKQYLKDPHLLTVSMIWDDHLPEQPFSVPNIDFSNYSAYNYGSQRDGNIRFADFVSDVRAAFPKPVMPGEKDNLEVQTCGKLDYHNDLWATTFSGAMSTNLSWHWRQNYLEGWHSNYNALSNFLQGVDFEDNNWQPYHSFSDNESVEQFYMVNNERKEAMGWLHNRTAYWANVTPDCYYDTDYDNNGIMERHYCAPDDESENGICLNNDFISSIFESIYYVENMSPGTLLNVDFFDTYTGAQLSSTPFDEIANVLSDGKAYFIAPTMDETKPDWSFKLYEGPEFRSTVKEPELRDTAVCPRAIFSVRHLLKNFADSNATTIWAYNGVQQQGINASFTATDAGWAELKLYSTGHSLSDTLTAHIFIKDCNQKQPVALESQKYEANDYNIKRQKHPLPNFNNNNNNITPSKIDNSSIRVYPVPSSGFINIEVINTNSEQRIYRVYNLLGEIIHEKMSIQSHLMLDLSNAAKGFYLLTVTEENGLISNYKLEIK